MESQSRMYNLADELSKEVNNSSVPSASCEGLDCHSRAVFNWATAITIFLAVFGALGNFLTALAILSSQLRRNINSILICNLSLADAIYCSVALPIQALSFYHQDWTLPDKMCALHAGLRIWLIGVNMTLLSCIALYRFLHVVHPQAHTFYSQQPWFPVAVLFCWAFPFLFGFTPLINLWGDFDFQAKVLQCTFSAEGSKLHKVITITLGYVVPCVFICVCYARIGCVVFASRKRSSRGSVYRRQKARVESFRLTGMMILIFLGFMLGTTPYFTINTLDASFRFPLVHIWSSILAWVMYSFNPVIYTVMDHKFQLAYKRLLLCQWHRPRSSDYHSSAIERQSSIPQHPSLLASKKVKAQEA